MSIGSKHYYRFTYLKSDHWQNLRLQKIASVNLKCKICKKEDFYNDVHHINYRKLHDVTLDDLVVLCRDCHTKAHTVLEECQFLKRLSDSKIKWKKTENKIRHGLRPVYKLDKMKPHQLKIAANRHFKEAAMQVGIDFPIISIDRKISFFVTNTNATPKEWMQFAFEFQ